MRESRRRLASDSELHMSGEDRTARRATRRAAGVAVLLLDGTELNIQLNNKSTGGELLDAVCSQLELRDVDYFGLKHERRGELLWLDLNKKLSKSFRNTEWYAHLCVKFYPSEPSQLQDEAARYQLALAVRRDVHEGKLPCSPLTAALLASYVLQAERGDSEECRDVDVDLLRELRAAPEPCLEEAGPLLHQLTALYENHKGQSPADAEMLYLENAKKLPLYGAESHAARDADNADIAVAVNGHGLAVYRDGLVLNRFPWAKILKLAFNKRTFRVTLRPSDCDEYETQLTFLLASSRASKTLWRTSVEHHMFFRRAEPVAVSRIQGFSRLGSRRLSCRRTLAQMRDSAAGAAVC